MTSDYGSTTLHKTNKTINCKMCNWCLFNSQCHYSATTLIMFDHIMHFDHNFLSLVSHTGATLWAGMKSNNWYLI